MEFCLLGGLEQEPHCLNPLGNLFLGVCVWFSVWFFFLKNSTEMLILDRKSMLGRQDWCSKVSWVSEGQFRQGFKINFSVRKMEKALFYFIFFSWCCPHSLPCWAQEIGILGEGLTWCEGEFSQLKLRLPSFFYWSFWDRRIPNSTPKSWHPS